MKKNKEKIKRTESSIISFSLAFSAMKYNLMAIEDSWTNNSNIKSVPVMAYFNYLSLYALCIELGLKDIIINQNEIDKTHNIKELFYKTHKIFQRKIQLLYEDSYKSDFLLDEYLDDISNMFEDLRYLELSGNTNYGKFLEKEGTDIEFKELLENNTYLNFLLSFCDEIYELILFLENQSRKKSKLNYQGLNEIEKKIIWKKKILDECLSLDKVET